MPVLYDPGVDPLDASHSWDRILSYSVGLGYSTGAAWILRLALLLGLVTGYTKQPHSPFLYNQIAILGGTTGSAQTGFDS